MAVAVAIAVANGTHDTVRPDGLDNSHRGQTVVRGGQDGRGVDQAWSGQGKGQAEGEENALRGKSVQGVQLIKSPPPIPSPCGNPYQLEHLERTLIALELFELETGTGSRGEAARNCYDDLLSALHGLYNPSQKAQTKPHQAKKQHANPIPWLDLGLILKTLKDF